jgi:membrane protease YdiL (CAAX protease family)
MRRKLIPFLLGLANLLIASGPSIGVMVLLRNRVPTLLGLLVGTALLVGVYVAGCRWIERREPIELWANNAVRQLLTGFSLGLLLFSCVMGILAAFGSYRVSGWTSWQPLGLGLLLAMLSAVFEEILFRGFLFRLFAGLAGNWVALALTAALFGLAHRANPHATPASSAAIATEAGILLGAAYAASGSLWLPIGIHAGWNFIEGPIFGMAVSGHELAAGLITGNLHGPVMLTGGAFGPEASIIAVAVCLVAAAWYLSRMKTPVAQQLTPKRTKP